MPARALKNPFVERLLKEEKIPHKCPFNCLKTCSGEDSIYCIADVLLKSVSGDVENGLVFCGSNVYKVNEIVPVKDLMKELTNDL
jgi:NAD(P)H-dependent flavin oxidoreductase YrpB (nitropropane dioxygenase family)